MKHPKKTRRAGEQRARERKLRAQIQQENGVQPEELLRRKFNK